MHERNPESRGLMPIGIVQSQIVEILDADAERASGSPRLGEFFYDKLHDKLVKGATLGSGFFSFVQIVSITPPIEDPWMNTGVRLGVAGLAGVSGAIAGFMISEIGSLAGVTAISNWKDWARFTNRFIL